MTPEDAAALIGIPYVRGGRDKRGFDCWGLLLWIYQEHFSKRLPDLPGISAAPIPAITAEAQRQKDSEAWEVLAGPEAFCVVGLSANRLIHHVGLWLPFGSGLVLHAVEGACVLAQPLASLRASGFSTIEFYRFLSCSKP